MAFIKSSQDLRFMALWPGIATHLLGQPTDAVVKKMKSPTRLARRQLQSIEGISFL